MNKNVLEGGQGKKLTQFQLDYMNALPSMIDNRAFLKYSVQNDKRNYKGSLLSESQREAIIQAVEEDRNLTASEIQRNKILNHFNVSLSTIERILNEVGLRCRRNRVMQGQSESNNSNLVFEEQFTEFIQKYYERVPEIWQQARKSKG